MKKTYILSTIAVLALIAGTTQASALSLGATVNGNTSVSTDRSDTTISNNTSATVSADRSSDRNENNYNGRGMMNTTLNAMMSANMEHWKNWMYNNGVVGTVTATGTNSITVKAPNGTLYSVATTNANIRYANGATAIQTGDNVFVQGAVNGTSIVATTIIDAKAGTAKPSSDDTRNAIVGTVTAKNGTTLTVIGKNGTTYTVTADKAAVWKTGHQSSSVSDIALGDAVVVQGTVSGSTVAATKIMAITFPSTSANGGIRGTVTAVNGNTITIMVAGGTTYSVNATNATVTDRKAGTMQTSDIHVGDTVVVNGDVSGSTVNATSISEAKVHEGFFARLGGFFKRLFGKKTDQ